MDIKEQENSEKKTGITKSQKRHMKKVEKRKAKKNLRKEKQKREQFENVTETMCESLYELLLKLSNKSNKTLKEQWAEYLSTVSEKKKASPDFRIMQKYIENRIEENEKE